MKNFILILVILLALPYKAFAVNLRTDIYAEHGPKLNKALYPIRHKFQKATHKDWKTSTLEDRKKFLIKYYTALEEQQKKDAERQREERRAELMRNEQKRQERQKAIDKQRAKDEAARTEQRAKDQEKRDFGQKVRNREDKLKSLRH